MRNLLHPGCLVLRPTQGSIRTYTGFRLRRSSVLTEVGADVTAAAVPFGIGAGAGADDKSEPGVHALGSEYPRITSWSDTITQGQPAVCALQWAGHVE
jgi:hypothetical protein